MAIQPSVRLLLLESIDRCLRALSPGRRSCATTSSNKIGFEKLGVKTSTQPKSLIRMFGPRGSPKARNLFGVLDQLQNRAGLVLHLETGSR